MRRALVLFVLAVACGRSDPVPRDTQLWRIDGSWTAVREGVRTAPAAVIVFRSSGEFVSLRTTLIERADGTVYLLARAPRVSMVGQWEQSGSKVSVKPKRISTGESCNAREYRVAGVSVEGDGGTYTRVTRLVAPEFDAIVQSARDACPAEE